MKHLPIAFFAAMALAGCGNTPAPAVPANASPSAQAEVLQCGKDTDCKGDRICEQGACVAPIETVLPAAGVGDALQSAADRATAAGPDESTPIPVCQANDPRTKVPVWEPSRDSHDGWVGEPPMNDGQIVYVRVSGDMGTFNCKPDDLQTVSIFETPGDALDGGLAINLRGNTHFANGVCYIHGFFMNEPVPGMHQGWAETFFGAVPKQQIVLSDRYCLDTGS